jgi:hypothetical protein
MTKDGTAILPKQRPPIAWRVYDYCTDYGQSNWLQRRFAHLHATNPFIGRRWCRNLLISYSVCLRSTCLSALATGNVCTITPFAQLSSILHQVPTLVEIVGIVFVAIGVLLHKEADTKPRKQVKS